MTDDEGPKPRYQWKRIDHVNPLFSGWDGERHFGRLLDPANDPGNWQWNLVCLGGIIDRSALGTSWYGTAKTARLAVKACEDAYDAAMAGTLFGMTQKNVEDMRAHEEFMRRRRAGEI